MCPKSSRRTSRSFRVTAALRAWADRFSCDLCRVFSWARSDCMRARAAASERRRICSRVALRRVACRSCAAVGLLGLTAAPLRLSGAAGAVHFFLRLGGVGGAHRFALALSFDFGGAHRFALTLSFDFGGVQRFPLGLGGDHRLGVVERFPLGLGGAHLLGATGLLTGVFCRGLGSSRRLTGGRTLPLRLGADFLTFFPVFLRGNCTAPQREASRSR